MSPFVSPRFAASLRELGVRIVNVHGDETRRIQFHALLDGDGYNGESVTKLAEYDVRNGHVHLFFPARMRAATPLLRQRNVSTTFVSGCPTSSPPEARKMIHHHVRMLHRYCSKAWSLIHPQPKKGKQSVSANYLYGIRPPDATWKKMKGVYDACTAANLPIPDEVDKFFNGAPPDTLGVRVELVVSHEKTCHEAVRLYKAEMQEGFEVDISKLPPDIKVLRFVHDYD